MRSFRTLCVTMLAAMVIAPAAVADATAEQDARARFKKGVELFEAGDHAAALAEFLAAAHAHHNPAITYNIARARESLGQAQGAVEAYESYLAEAGAGGELSAAATLAIAEIKGRSTRVRIETQPAGARVRVAGTELSERTPTSVLLFRGTYTIEVELDDWRERRALDVPGGGSTSDLSFVRSASPPAPKPAPTTSPAPRPDSGAPAAKPPKPPELDGLMGTFALSMSGYSFLGEAEESEQQSETSADAAAKGVVFGLAFDVGWALSSRTALLLRGFGGLGSSRDELAALGAGGPALSYRLSDDLWIGLGAIFGGSRAESDATTKEQDPITQLSTEDNSSITYRTDFAVGPSVEISYSLWQTGNGQWLVSLIPGMLLTTGSRESTLFVPLLIGYRWF